MTKKSQNPNDEVAVVRTTAWSFVIGNSLVIRNQELVIFQQTRAVECRQKILFDFGETASGNRGARHQNEFHRLGQLMLMLPETFAEQTPRAAAFHRAADFAAGDDAEPGRRPSRQPVPVGNQTTLRQSLALLSHPREIPIVAKARLAFQPQTAGVGRLGSGGWGRGRHEHARVKPASGVCGPRGGGCGAWRGRFWWICGREIRAAVCAGFSTVDTGVS